MEPKSLNVVARQLSTRFFNRHAISAPRRRWSRCSSRVSRLEALEARLLMHASPVLDAEHLAVFGARDATTGVDHRRPGARFVADLYLRAQHHAGEVVRPEHLAIRRPRAGRRQHCPARFPAPARTC